MTLVLADGREAVRRSTRATWLSLGTSVILVALLVAAYVNLAARSGDLQDGIREDALWAVYQIGRETGALAATMRDAVADGILDAAETDALTLRYDILYSRMSVRDGARYGSYFADDGDIRGERSRVRSLIASMETTFDGLKDRSTTSETLTAKMGVISDLVGTSEALLLRTNSVVNAARADARAELLRLQDGAAWIVLALVVSVGLLVLSLCHRLRATHAIGEQIQAVADQLKTAFAAADAGNRAKSEFMATMGHEIRTPLNAILGLAELLSMSDLSADDRESVDAIGTSGTALLEVINEILDYTKIEHGDLGTESVPFDPVALVRETAVVVHGRARERGNKVTVEDTQISGLFMGDPARLRRVLLNLMSNAVKFTDQGSVKVRLSEVHDVNERRLRFEVCDSGIGIAPAARHLLFVPFSQVDGSISRRFGGTGLGLAICKRIVEAAGGTIGVDSEPGIGSCFWFEIPAAPAAVDHAAVSLPSAPPADATPSVRRRVLVVEDNAFNRKVAGRFLEKLGHATTFAENGEVAVRLAAEVRFDLILMDMQMPVLDGIEATRAIRAAGGPSSAVPIVALTANASDSDRERCVEVGMNSFETKPVPMERLRALVARWCDNHEPMTEAVRTDAGRGGDRPFAAIVDAARVADLVEAIGEDGLVELREAFASDAASLLLDLGAAMAANDPVWTDAVLHTIKGSASNIGYSAVAELAEAMRLAGPDDGLRAQLADELRRVSAGGTIRGTAA